ncbi:MAG: FMN-binding protein [Candidatus Doudnabacteria bacterium]|nr:FMN-binding protein [Candidatus Doudnabacteria bacterium]
MLKKIIYSVVASAFAALYVFFGRNISQVYSPVLNFRAPGQTSLTTSVLKDGDYTGKTSFAFYGYVQVFISVLDGKLAEVIIKDSPKSRLTSEVVNGQALSGLIEEALNVQSAEVDIITGATDTSLAFKESLRSALQKAAE